MRRTPLARKGKTETAKIKDRIQGLLRSYCLLRDGGCVLAPFQGNGDIPMCCSDVLQCDHLNSRQFSVSYANPHLAVIVCKGHHGWKHFSDRNTRIYMELVRKIIGPRRAKMLEMVENDRLSHRMTAWDWEKEALALENMIENF